MLFYYCLVLPLLGIAHGSPYYYREDKHHSEHHKEYSYSNGQPSSTTYDSSPQKYIESSHFSTHVTPERYYRVESGPSFSSGFNQYSGGSQSAFHQSEFQSSGMKSSHLSPLLTGQSMNLEGVKPGTYVIKQVKVYGQPTTYTGFYGSSSQLDGRALETGQQEEALYGSQHEQDINTKGEQYFKQVQASSYHQVPQVVPTITNEESLLEQKPISEEDCDQFGQQQISGQKEESIYNEHLEDFGQHPQRGDLDIGQEQENLNAHHSQLVKALENKPIDDNNKGYKYYEKRIITYGSPEKDSNGYAHASTYVHQTQRHGPMENGGKNQDIHLGPTTVKTPNSFENIQTVSRQETKHTRYSQEAVALEKKDQPIRSQSYNSNPGHPIFIPHPVPIDTQNYGRSLEEGQHEESLYGQQSPDLGQQLVSDSLEIGQQPDRTTGQQLETGDSFELGQNQESLSGKHVHSWEKHINTSTVEVKSQRTGLEHKPFGQQLTTEHLEIGQSSNKQPHVLVKQNVTRTLIVGHNFPTPSQNQRNFQGQIEETASGQNMETGFFELGQQQENVGQLESSDLGIGQHEETLEIGQKSDNFGQHPEQEVMPDNDKLKLGQRQETPFDLELSKSASPIKLIVNPTKPAKYNEHTSYVKTFSQHESHYNELKQSPERDLKDIPTYNQKYDSTTTPRNNEQENTNKKNNYVQLQQKAEELALQLGLEDISKLSSQQESYEDKFVKENKGKTLTTNVHKTEIQEHEMANHHSSEKVGMLPNKKITWETRKEEYGLNYPLTSQGSYSKKQTNHYENQGYSNQPMLQNYGYQGQNQHLSHYGGYRQGYAVNNGERTYFSDQPIQRTHTSGSQFSFSSSSGSSQDKQKAIDDFLKELDKDIARTNYQQRQQQGSYAEMVPSRPVNSGVSYYSQRTVSTHSNSSYGSTGTVPGEITGKAWYQRIGDSLGSSYNQAKEKAKDIVKTVKQSVGYSHS